MLWWIAQNIIIVAILAAVVSMVCRWKRLSPAARHALWLVVLIKLITPPLFVWPWAIPISAELVSEGAHGEVSQPKQLSLQKIELPVMIDAKGESDTETDNLIVSSETFVIPLDAGINPEVTSSSTPVLPKLQSVNQPEQSSRWSWERGIFWGSLTWMTGIVLMVLWQGLRIRQMNRLVKNARPAADWLVRLVEETAVLLPVRPPRVHLVSGVSTPILWAWGQPVLLWPEGLSDQLSPEARQGVILHELAHLKRKDHWVGRLELVAGCLWWPNPLFWYVRHQLRENAELACDAWVTQTLPEGRRDYADALLTVCENYSHPAVPLPALGMGKSTRRTLERRLTMILRDRVPFRVSGWGVAAVLLLGVLILPGWSQSKQETPQLPEAESLDDVIDELAEPAAVVETVEEVLVEPVVEDDILVTKPPMESAITVDVELGDELEVGLEVWVENPNTSRNRELRLQKLEQKLQVLLAELQALRGQRQVRESPVPKQESAADRKKAATLLLKQARSALKAGRPEVARRSATEASRLGVNYHLFDDRPYLILADVAEQVSKKNNSALQSQLNQTAVAKREKPAEVVETKTITLVRTTYRITRVDAKMLESLLKKVVQADVLQIQLYDEIQKTANGIAVPGSTEADVVRNLLRGQAIQRITITDPKMITVTTTPETQQYIGRLIALIEKAPQKPSARKPASGSRQGQSSFNPLGSPIYSGRTTGESEPQLEPNAGRESILRGRAVKSRTTKQDVRPQSNSSRRVKSSKREKTEEK